MAENFLTKETAGLPNYVWGIGVIVGLYLANSLKGSGSSTSTSPDGSSALVTGNTQDQGATTCPVIQPPVCNAGETIGYTNDPQGCPIPHCVAATGSTPTQPPTPPAQTNAVCYTVQHGDYLSLIASKEGTPGGVNQLVEWNSTHNACSATGFPSLLINDNLIYAGWVLRVR